MQRLYDLISNQQDWVLQRVIEYAKEYDYVRYTSTLVDAWRASIQGLNHSILAAIRAPGSIPRPGPDDQFASTAIDQFSREEVRKHRARGVTLGMFLGLVKYYRQSYLDLIREADLSPAQEQEYLGFLERFFDRFEIGYSVEWNSIGFDEKIEELQAQNRLITNEKNKYLTIFDSLYDPVILLSPDNRIENINQAAAELFAEHSLHGPRYYDQHPVAEAFPWLADELTAFTAQKLEETIFDKRLEAPLGERFFQVKMKHMQDVSGKYRGVVLILNDLTERKKKEEALILNRAIERWVNTLVEIGHHISSMDSLEAVLLSVVGAAQSLLGTRFAALGLWDADRQRFEIGYLAERGQVRRQEGVFQTCEAARPSATDGPPAVHLEQIGRKIGAEIHNSQDAFQPLSLDDEAGPESAIAPAFTLALPLQMNGRMIGALWVGRETPFSPSAQVVLESLANQAVIAIEHDGMANRMQSLATLDERTRIAREMHDGLAQILGFLNLEMQSLEALIRQNRIEDTLAELQQARKRILEAQAEVRENILSLRTTLSGAGRAIPALEEYIREFGVQTGMQVHIQADASADLPLSSMAEVQLVRIVQEALTNVRRHAQAANVWVAFHSEVDHLCVEVSDDGVGFNPGQPNKRYGLQSMRERAAGIGGRLEINSQPGQGACIRLCVPLQRQGRAAARTPA
jgi:signal transduction histidine kinase